MTNRLPYITLTLAIPLISFSIAYFTFNNFQKQIQHVAVLAQEKFKYIEHKLPVPMQNFINNKLKLITQDQENKDQLGYQVVPLGKLFYSLLYIISLLTFLFCLILAHVTCDLMLKYSLIDGGFFAFLIGIFFNPSLLNFDLSSVFLRLILISFIAFYEYNSRRARFKNINGSTYLP